MGPPRSDGTGPGTRGRLVGGTTTTEFGDCELRGDFDRGGTLIAGGKSITVKTGRVVIRSTGRRGPIRLGDGASVEHLVIRPLGLRTLFDGRSLTGCTPLRPPRHSQEPGQRGPREEKLHAKGGPGAMELPGRFADFLLQVEVRTRGSARERRRLLPQPARHVHDGLRGADLQPLRGG